MQGARQPVALVLVNLGTPEACNTGAIRKFLREFLSDRRVVEIPRPIWWLILNIFVLPFRPAKVAEAYEVIWTERGSPLRYHTEDQVSLLSERMQKRYPDSPPTVRYAMTYGKPSIDSVLNELYESGHRRMVVLPMYPQYSCSTTAPIYDQISAYTYTRNDLKDTERLAPTPAVTDHCPVCKLSTAIFMNPPISKRCHPLFNPTGTAMVAPRSYCFPITVCHKHTSIRATPIRGTASAPRVPLQRSSVCQKTTTRWPFKAVSARQNGSSPIRWW